MLTCFWLAPALVLSPGVLPRCGSAGKPIRTAASAIHASLQAAWQTCSKLLPGGGAPRVAPDNVKVAMLKNAQCMRAHGVPNYPDPVFPPGRGVESFIPSSAAANSPAFQSAAQMCGGG